MWPRTWVSTAAVLTILAGGTASAAEPDNLAFVDQTQTQSVIDQASAMLVAVLSYDYRRLDENAQLAKEKGTDAYVGQHTDMLNKARTTATRQKQLVTTTVAGAGVRDLRADTARLVVFLDQATNRGDTNRTATAGFTAVVDLRRVGTQWKLDGVSSIGP
jgi:Mce-associated membrane protein